MKILIINGPNLNLLGERDANHYGEFTLSELEKIIAGYFPEDEFHFFQSNIEGEIVQAVQKISRGGFEGLIINPGGYSHTSVAIRDALEVCKTPKIEVHLSNISSREEFRRHLITGEVCDGIISGLKEFSYISAIFALKAMRSH